MSPSEVDSFNDSFMSTPLSRDKDGKVWSSDGTASDDTFNVVGGVTSDGQDSVAEVVDAEVLVLGDVVPVVTDVTVVTEEITDDAEGAVPLLADWIPDCTEDTSSVGVDARRSFLERTLGEGRDRRRRDASGMPPARIFN